MNKSTIMVLFLIAITIFGATNTMAFQGAVAQNYYNNEETYADHYLPQTMEKKESMTIAILTIIIIHQM